MLFRKCFLGTLSVSQSVKKKSNGHFLVFYGVGMFGDGADLPNESRHKGPIMMVKGGPAYEMEEIMLLRLRPQ